MKTKSAPTAIAEAMHLATLKVAQTRRIVEAGEKLARAAKVRFKSAKKTWKLARKTARRSAKKLKQAEKHLAALETELKRAKSKAGKNQVGKAVAAKATKPSGKKRQRATIPAPASVSAASSAAFPQITESARD